MEKDSAPLSPVLFSCTGQIDEKRTSFLVVSMPQQCCLHSRLSSRRVDLPPRRRRRTFFVPPRPDTGDIIEDKGNTTCPPNCSPSSDVINVCPPAPTRVTSLLSLVVSVVACGEGCVSSPVFHDGLCSVRLVSVEFLVISL